MSESDIVRATSLIAQAREQLGVAWHIGGSVACGLANAIPCY